MKHSVVTPAYIRHFWAKAYPYRTKGPERIHLLEHHMADVGACFERLLAQPTICARLAGAGGLNELDDTTVARLSLLAALHDIGKVNLGFQTQIWTDADLPEGRLPSSFKRVGHIVDLTPVLIGEDEETAGWFFNALGWWEEATSTWDDRGGETACALFVAALSHHGSPLQLEGGRSRNPGIWRSYCNLTPEAWVRDIGRRLKRWFPEAFAPDAPPLPSAPQFQHIFLGLCTLADWIGSNAEFFSFCPDPREDYMAEARCNAKGAIREVMLDIGEQRGEMLYEFPTFSQLFDFDLDFEANAIQRAAVEETPIDEQLVIIESETGSGKTEAALWRFAHMYRAGLVDGLYFALPTRAAATQLHKRVNRFVDKAFPLGHRPETVLAVPGYIQARDVSGKSLPGFEVEWEDHPEDGARHRRWAAERPRQYLAAQIAVGTVDQAMMAALKVRHAHVRAACLARNLLVIDEVHASDAYMRPIVKALIKAHLQTGGYALLMSATLGSVARREWLSSTGPSPDPYLTLEEAIEAPYPAVSCMTRDTLKVSGKDGRDKKVRMEPVSKMQDFDEAARRALDAAVAGAKVIVIRNTVEYAIKTQLALEKMADVDNLGVLFTVIGEDGRQGVTTLHHGRFAAGDRRALDRGLEEKFGKDRGLGGIVVVGTQTLEQSLDIDADFLITDLCPADILLQRIGRLHRHPGHDRPDGYSSPRCVVLTPEDMSPFLDKGPDKNGLGPHGYVYEDLRALEATRRLIGEHSEWHIPKMNRKLVERATHPEALEEIVEIMGGGKWRTHANKVEGEYIAEGLTASQVIIPRNKSFFGEDNRDLAFPSKSEENIRTRLGDDRIDIAIDPMAPSPFDGREKIDKLSVSVRWLPEGERTETVAPSVFQGGFTFSVGDRAFRYDRLGLHKEG